MFQLPLLSALPGPRDVVTGLLQVRSAQTEAGALLPEFSVLPMVLLALCSLGCQPHRPHLLVCHSCEDRKWPGEGTCQCHPLGALT